LNCQPCWDDFLPASIALAVKKSFMLLLALPNPCAIEGEAILITIAVEKQIEAQAVAVREEVLPMVGCRRNAEQENR